MGISTFITSGSDFQQQAKVAFAYAKTTVSTASPIFADNIGDNFTIVLDAVIARTNNLPPLCIV